MAAAAPLSGPTVFSVKPWTINRADSQSAPAADFADFAGSADSEPTLPKQTLLPNLPTLSRGLPLPQCLSQQSFSSSLGLSSPSRLIASTCCRFCRLCRFRRRCRFQHCPPCLNQRCFVSVSPRQIFLPGLDSPSSSPCSSKNLRCRFSPTNLQPHKSALPNLPTLSRGLPLPQCLNLRSFSSSLGLSSPSRPIASTRCRFCRLCRFRRRCRFHHCPPCLNQRCFVSVSPR